MPGVIALPEVITSTATDLATIGSNLSAAHAMAAAPTLAVQSAAADEISTGVAQLFSQHARDYQALAGQATAFHEQFVQHVAAGASSYAGAEAANVALLQPLNAAGSIASAVGGLQGQAANLLNTVQSELLNLIDTVRVQLLNLALNSVLLFIAILVVLFLLAIATISSLSAANPE